MKSLKQFKKMLIQGKESPLQDENLHPIDLKIPQIRQSAYKILTRKRQKESGGNVEIKQHSLTRKQPLKIPSRSISPLRPQISELGNTANTIQNIQKQLDKGEQSKLTMLELTGQELQYLEKVINFEKQQHENKIKEGESLTRIQEKVAGLRKKYASSNINNEHKKEQSSFQNKYHHSQNQTQILSVPFSFEDTNKTESSELSNSSDQKQKQKIKEKGSIISSQGSVYDRNGLQFRKIMYILQSKTRAIESKSRQDVVKFKHPMTNNYRLLEQNNIQSISFRGNQKDSQKKVQLYQIVSMLNNKYKRNIHFN